MKMSEWIKKYDEEHPDRRCRAINLDDFLAITEFDVGMQHGINKKPMEEIATKIMDHYEPVFKKISNN